MTKSLFKTFVFLVLLAGLAAMTFAAQIFLRNGKVLDGPIVSVTPASVTIKDAVMGEITTPRVEILRAVPPLGEGRPALPAQVSGLGRSSAASLPKKGGLKFGFNLGGGLSNMDGGDFNKIIRDMNTYGSDTNDAFQSENIYSIDWKEMKRLNNFRAELFLRIGPYFGIGLGAEYMKKTNPGLINYHMWGGYEHVHSAITELYSFNQIQTTTQNQTMTVIPLTLNLYGFAPLGNRIEFYVNLGSGIYFGTLEGTYTETINLVSKYIFYKSGSLYPPHNYSERDYNTTSQYKATNSVLGFHFGGGFNFKLSSAVSLYVEGFYRIANFNNWQGDASWSWTESLNSGATNNPDGPGPSTTTDSGSGGVTGKIWYWEDCYPGLAAQYYGQYNFFAAGEEPKGEYNCRPAEFNINGFSFRIGFKIGFDLN